MPMVHTDGKRDKTIVFVAYSDIPIAYSYGKRNKTNFVFAYSHIPMAYPDGKRNETHAGSFILILRWRILMAKVIKPMCLYCSDIPIADLDCKRNKTVDLLLLLLLLLLLCSDCLFSWQTQ